MRLRQQYPNNYLSSGNISAEFENVIRYLVAAERGNRTIGELLAQLFDVDGDFDAPIEFRVDSVAGLQVRVGIYSESEPEVGWETLYPLASLRGDPGANVGQVGLPVLHQRADYIASAAQTEFSYAHTSSDLILVFKNGVLLRPGALFDYTTDADTDLVELTSGAALNDKITIFKARNEGGVSAARNDVTPASPQTVFSYVFPTISYQLVIYKNGVLLREGAGHDYTLSTATNTITFASAIQTTDTVSFVTFSTTDADTVTGFMMEGNYANPATGLIYFDKIEIADDEIPQAKVDGLVAALAAGAKLVVSSTTPVSPPSGQLWIDTSAAPNILKFWDGSTWISTSPESSLPTLLPTNASQFVRVNSTGTGYILSDIDFSSLIPLSAKGSASGVAELDSTGIVPESQLPAVKGIISEYHKFSGSVTDSTLVFTRLYKTRVRIIGLSAHTSSGTCNLQLSIAGTAVGPVYGISSSTLDQSLATALDIDALTISKTVALVITSASSAQNLEVTLSLEIR